MLKVKTPEEAMEIIVSAFKNTTTASEIIPLKHSLGRTLCTDVIAQEYVPDFNRSTVDGYAVFARDTFGCSESIPAIIPVIGEIKMGSSAALPLEKGTCLSVPTGGDVPAGADAVVMLEYTEDYGDGTIGILKPVAPGENMIFRGDDVSPGESILSSGHIITPHDIGALAAVGASSVSVCTQPLVGIISTGDELVDYTKQPQKGQIRDVNTPMLDAVIQQAGGRTKLFGIIQDSTDALTDVVNTAIAECDAVLISGGSSVGMKDATARVIEKSGRILFHGIAMKPGKPTILGEISKKPIIGLPGHPVAAYFVSRLFVVALLSAMTGRHSKTFGVTARLTEAISANHGRAEYISVTLDDSGEAITARPIHGKSGLITALKTSDGYICIPRDCEGLARGTSVTVTLWNR